jgi:hypothetical protein
MTPHPPKKAAEGPFHDKMFIGGWIYDLGINADWELNGLLVLWLKTPSGKRWMEENGVGNA